VAVDVDPTVWQAYCEECDKYVSDTTDDVKYAEKKGLVHLATNHIEHSNMEPA
jgi:hypothetical protein